MKISRKMKKILVTFLATTLSIIMFVTSTSAANIVSYREYFEHEGVVDAIESMGWHKIRNMFSFGVDLECYECDNVDTVYASLAWDIYYPSSSEPESHELDDFFTPENTWDSDELGFTITDFACSYDTISIDTEITYCILYDNGDMEMYVYIYDIDLVDNYLDYTRDRILHAYIYADE